MTNILFSCPFYRDHSVYYTDSFYDCLWNPTGKLLRQMKGIKENFALSSIVTVFNKPFNFFDGYRNKKNKDLWLIYEIQAILYYTTTTTTLF